MTLEVIEDTEVFMVIEAKNKKAFENRKNTTNQHRGICMRTSKALVMTLVVTIFVGITYVAAQAGDPIVIGDYVWFDANCDGIQNDGTDAGINDVLVWFYRDYDCNGILDGDDAVYDYDFTRNDDYGVAGYYEIPSTGTRCFVVELDEETIPEGLFVRSGTSMTVATDNVDYMDADYGLCDEQTEDEYGECDGKVTELTLSYLGSQEVYVQIYAKVSGRHHWRHHRRHGRYYHYDTLVFSGEVGAGEEFTVYGPDRRGTLGTEIKVFVNGEFNTKIHTSCSVPIGPGLVAGDFMVTDGYSRNGGKLPPLL